MNSYFALYFSNADPAPGILKKWMLKQGQSLQAGEVLFIFDQGSQERSFSSPVSGIVKAFLEKEGDSLQVGAEIAVFELPSPLASESEKLGLGKMINPEELKELAEAASIRLPPEEKP